MKNTSRRPLKHSFEKICSHSDHQFIGSAVFVFTYKTVMHANHQHNAMVNAHNGVHACFLQRYHLMWGFLCEMFGLLVSSSNICSLKNC